MLLEVQLNPTYLQLKQSNFLKNLYIIKNAERGDDIMTNVTKWFHLHCCMTCTNDCQIGSDHDMNKTVPQINFHLTKESAASNMSHQAAA
jgi:uncharacterized protein YrrD